MLSEVWSKTVSAHGVQVRLYQRQRGGPIYRSVALERELSANGNTQTRKDRRSLKHSDRALAEKQAKDLCRELAEGQLTGRAAGSLTLGQLLTAYRLHRVPSIAPPRRREAATKAAMFIEAWGRDLPVADIDQTRCAAYCAARRSLEVVAPGLRPDQEGRRRRGYRAPQPPRDGALDGEFRFLNIVLNWGCGFRIQGRPLLSSNPIPRGSQARRALGWPVEKNPRRPVAAHDRYTRTLERAADVDAAGRLRCILALARHTGRRESAICALNASDLLLSRERIRGALAEAGLNEQDAEHMPHGAIRWRDDSDKVGYLFITPLNLAARAEVDAYQRRSARVGEVPLFPAPGKRRKKGAPAPPDVAIRRETAAKWLLRAERLAELPKLRGGVFHCYRRLWAIERRHLPAIDVAAAGGWGDTQALTRIYQKADAAGVAAAVNLG